MKISVINLDQSTHRLKIFMNSNRHIKDIRRFSAVNGAELDREELIEKGFLSPDISYTDGALGVAMSHILLWNAVIEQQTPLIITEDDSILCRNFMDESQKLIEQSGEGWDIVLFGYNFDTGTCLDVLPGFSGCFFTMDQVSMRRNAYNWPDCDRSSVAYRLFRTLGIHCYAISPAGAAKLLQFCVPLREMSTLHPLADHEYPNTGIDNMMAHVFPAINAYAAFPPVAISRNFHGSSTVQDITSGSADLVPKKVAL